jgi:hypothetical protein
MDTFPTTEPKVSKDCIGRAGNISFPKLNSKIKELIRGTTTKYINEQLCCRVL